MSNTDSLEKLCRFLNSVRGTDKVFMFIQYSFKIITAFLLRKNPESSLATRLLNFSNPISDTRILLRYYGLIPLYQWIRYSEKFPAPTQKLQWIIRLENLVNVLYYPLEHLYWLGLHSVVPISPQLRDKIGMWSCRFWASYVILYFYQLFEEYKMLQQKKLGKVSSQDLQVIKSEQKVLFLNTVVNSAYFPLTVHWSLENSSLSDLGVGVFGTVAAIGQIILAWKAS
jgi:hypothetical protein